MCGIAEHIALVLLGAMIGCGLGVFITAVCVASSDNNNNNHKSD